MPTVEVLDVGSVDFPEDMTQEQIETVLNQQYGQQQSQLSAPAPITLSPYEQARMQGAMPPMGTMGPASPEEVLALPELVNKPVEQISGMGGQALTAFLRETGIDPSAMQGQPVGGDIRADLSTSPLGLLPESTRTGIEKGLTDIGASLRMPESLATLPWFALKPVRALAAAQMTTEIPGEIQDIIKAQTPEERTQAATTAAANAAMTLALVHSTRLPKAAQAAAQSIIENEVKNAQTIREDTGQSIAPGSVGEGGQAYSGSDIQQAAPEPPNAPTSPPQAAETGSTRVLLTPEQTRVQHLVEQGEAILKELEKLPTAEQAIQSSVAPSALPTKGTEPVLTEKIRARLQAAVKRSKEEGLLGEEKKSLPESGTQMPRTSEQGPGTIGGAQMGAAGVEEIGDTGTGLKNAVGQMERAGLGLEQAPDTVKRNMAKAWTESGTKAATDPTAGEKLATDLIANPERGLTDADSALLLRHKVELWNRMNDAAERSHTGDEVSRQRASAEHQLLVTRFGQLLDAVKQRGAEWGREGRWRQAMAKEDFTFTDTDQFNRYHRTLTGQDLTPEQMDQATQVAGEVKTADNESAEADTALRNDLDSKAPRPTPEEAAKQAPLNDQAKAAKAAFDAANKTVRENAVRLATVESKKRVARTVAEKETADIQLKAAQKAQAAVDKVHRDAARAMAAAERKLRGDPIKVVWGKVREQLDRNPDQNFDDLRSKVAAELGMKPDAVARIMARDATTKRLMDDAWNKQQKARLLKQEAKRWVAGVDEQEWLKTVKSVPRGMFRLKTFGHTGVPLGTHAPMVAFDPRYAHLYFPAYKTMWKMVGSKSFYEMQVQDLQRRPNYITAQRGGLVNNPSVYEDYTSPEVTKYFTSGANPGIRSFTILKILRQDMFDMHWDKLPKSLQTDEMANELAQGINHITGVVTDPSQLKGRTGARSVAQIAKTRGVATALFAPKLEASRAMTLLLDPMRATWILTKSVWDRTSPAERQFAVQQLISKTMIAGTLFSLLKLNDLVNQVVGSKQMVNTTDPMRSDFLKFKVAGMDFAYGNAMISMSRMPLSVYRVIASDGGKTKSLVYADESIATVLFRFGRTQLSPFMGTLTDLGLGSDYASRPLPRALFGALPQNRPVPKRLQAEGLEPYTYAEYFSDQAAPIPFQEVVKSFWKYGFGMSDEQIKAYERDIAISAIMGATGGRLTEDVPPRTKSPMTY